MRSAYLGLGSNLGDKPALLEAALARLDATPGIAVRAISAFYRTPPWGKTDQDWFLNAAARIDTTLAPTDLLDACLATERTLGRERGERWGPRLIDIDILAYADVTSRDAALTLPHPHLASRAFVLVPLAEIAPDLLIEGRTVRDLLAGLDRTGITPIETTPPLSFRGTP